MDKDKKIQLLEDRVSKLEKIIVQLTSQIKSTHGRVVRTDEALRRTHLNIDRIRRELNKGRT